MLNEVSKGFFLKIMNKSAVFWLEFLSKRFRPGLISGVTSTGKSHWKVCIRHAYMTMSEVIVLISIASDIAPQKGIWQEYYWNFLFDTLSPLTNISQAQYNKCGYGEASFCLQSRSCSPSSRQLPDSLKEKTALCNTGQIHQQYLYAKICGKTT